MDSDRCFNNIRELIRNRILNRRDCIISWTDRSINRYWPTRPASRTGAWRNVGADCLVGGTRGLQVCFLLTFRKYKVFVERGHDTHAIAPRG